MGKSPDTPDAYADDAGFDPVGTLYLGPEGLRGLEEVLAREPQVVPEIRATIARYGPPQDVIRATACA